MEFVELKLGNGQPLDIPAPSVVFLETLDDAGRRGNPGCQSGLFFDLGNGPQVVIVQESFADLAAKIYNPKMVTLDRADGGTAMLYAANICALRGLAGDHPNDGACQVSHTVGGQVLLLDVRQSRDDIRQLLPAPAIANIAEA